MTIPAVETEKVNIVIVPGSMPYQDVMLLCLYIMRAGDFVRTGKVLTDEQYLDGIYARLKKAWDYEKYPHPASYTGLEG